MELVDIIESIKEKLTSQEYKELLENLAKLDNKSEETKEEEEEETENWYHEDTDSDDDEIDYFANITIMPHRNGDGMVDHVFDLEFQYEIVRILENLSNIKIGRWVENRFVKCNVININFNTVRRFPITLQGINNDDKISFSALYEQWNHSEYHDVFIILKNLPI